MSLTSCEIRNQAAGDHAANAPPNRALPFGTTRWMPFLSKHRSKLRRVLCRVKYRPMRFAAAAARRASARIGGSSVNRICGLPIRAVKNIVVRIKIVFKTYYAPSLSYSQKYFLEKKIIPFYLSHFAIEHPYNYTTSNPFTPHYIANLFSHLANEYEPLT